MTDKHTMESHRILASWKKPSYTAWLGVAQHGPKRPEKEGPRLLSESPEPRRLGLGLWPGQSFFNSTFDDIASAKNVCKRLVFEKTKPTVFPPRSPRCS